jgi:predicted nucleic acid-binding protein
VTELPALTLVDSNVLIDIATEDQTWFGWSSSQVQSLLADGPLGINPIIDAEISIGFGEIESIENAFPPEHFLRLPLPWEAAFLAGRTFLMYRRAGGVRRSPLPDFYIGAHAAVSGHALLTRDAARYATYFPRLTVIAP